VFLLLLTFGTVIGPWTHNNEWPVCAIVSSQTQSRSESCTLSLTLLERNTVSYKETLWATKKHCELQERRPSVPSGEQELFPDSGMFLSPFRLAAIHQASRQHCLHLFDLLFDPFFPQWKNVLIQLPLDAMARSPRGSESSTGRPAEFQVRIFVLRIFSKLGYLKNCLQQIRIDSWWKGFRYVIC
jgi:hypothetical protein